MISDTRKIKLLNTYTARWIPMLTGLGELSALGNSDPSEGNKREKLTSWCFGVSLRSGTITWQKSLSLMRVFKERCHGPFTLEGIKKQLHTWALRLKKPQWFYCIINEIKTLDEETKHHSTLLERKFQRMTMWHDENHEFPSLSLSLWNGKFTLWPSATSMRIKDIGQTLKYTAEAHPAQNIKNRIKGKDQKKCQPLWSGQPKQCSILGNSNSTLSQEKQSTIIIH